jgi:hypothetical protein
MVGELALVSGRPQPDATHMAVLKPPRRAHTDRRQETLFVFLDLTVRTSAGLAQAMLEQFSRTYWHSQGTVTRTLRKAIDAANAHMQEENRLLPVSQRQRGGLICAVLRGNDVYLAQMGPAKAWLRIADEITPFPQDPQQSSPLGMSRGLDIRYCYQHLRAGDMVLLTGERWSEELPREAFTAALSAGHGTAAEALHTLERQSDTNSASALIVEFVPSDVAADGVDGLESQPVSAVERPPAAAPRPDPYPPEAETVPAASSPTPLYSDPWSTTGVEDWEAPPGEGEPDGEGLSLKQRLAGILPPRAQLDRTRHSLVQAGGALGEGARTLLTRVLPEPEPLPRPERRQSSQPTENVAVMAGIAVAIPLLVAFIVATFYLQRSALARQESLLAQAQEAAQVARTANQEEARTRWEEALAAAQDALLVNPDDETLVALSAEARAKLDALDTAVRPELIHLWDYGAGPGRHLAATRLQVYVLDTGQNQVTQHALDEMQQGGGTNQANLVAYRGERVGDEVIGELQDIAWLEAADSWSSDALLILTRDNRLLQYSLTWGLTWVPFDTGLAHVNAHIMRPYQGRLYILDPQQSQVWRFPANGESFGPPEGYFPAGAPDLSTAIDMAIDGAVYILLENGTIYKFFGGEARPYELVGLPQPLVRPIALAVEGDSVEGALYVADAGTQSIIALTKEGQFIHQIKAGGDALAGLTTLTIEQRNRTLYLLAAGRLYALPLPALPEAAETSP